MDSEVRSRLIAWAEEYNDEKYFREDPIAFPKRFHDLYRRGKCSLADIEVAAVFAAHFAWVGADDVVHVHRGTPGVDIRGTGA